MRRRLGVLVCLGLMVGAPSVWAATYTIDQDHTTVTFRIRHILSYVRGTFDRFEGHFDYASDHPEQWKTEAVIQAASVDTRVEKRDNHLRSPDFLDAKQFPTIAFTSTQVTDVTPTSAKLRGLLTIHGIEKPVTLDLEILGEAKDPWGNVRAAFTATTRINRKEFGLTWNKVLETGQLLVGDEVEITLEVEGIQQPAGSPTG